MSRRFDDRYVQFMVIHSNVEGKYFHFKVITDLTCILHLCTRLQLFKKQIKSRQIIKSLDAMKHMQPIIFLVTKGLYRRDSKLLLVVNMITLIVMGK